MKNAMVAIHGVFRIQLDKRIVPKVIQQDHDISLAVEDERALIGTVLVWPETIDSVVSIVQPDDFVDQALGRVYGVLVHRFHTQGERRLTREDVCHEAIRAIGSRELGECSQLAIDPGYATYYAKEIANRSRHIEDDGIVKRGGPLLEKFAERVLSGKSQKLLEIKAPLDGLEIGPGLITVLGAGPGAGKTALASQVAFTHLECDSTATATFANAEMDFDALLIREVARRSCLPYKALRFAELDKYQREDFEYHVDQLRPLCKRIRWIEPPHSISSLMECEAFDPGLVIVDYLQKFSPTDCDARQGVGRVMTYLRHLAKSGWSVLALSATTRTQGKAGSGHDGKSLSMASFRESGEVEFNADAAYLLRHQGDIDGQSWLREIQLSCVKNRHGDLEERSLVFNAAGMRFEGVDPTMTHWEPAITAVASEAPTAFEGRF